MIRVELMSKVIITSVDSEIVGEDELGEFVLAVEMYLNSLTEKASDLALALRVSSTPGLRFHFDGNTVKVLTAF